MWNLKSKQKQTHKTENKLEVARGEGTRGKDKMGEVQWDIQASRQNELSHSSER